MWNNDNWQKMEPKDKIVLHYHPISPEKSFHDKHIIIHIEFNIKIEQENILFSF